MILNSVYKWLAGGVAVAILSYHYVTVNSLDATIGRLEVSVSKERKALSEAQTTIGLLRGQRSLLEGSIAKQNAAIMKEKSRYSTAKKELDRWKSKPDGDKYKDLYDTLNERKIDITKDDCETTENTINAVSSIDYNALQL